MTVFARRELPADTLGEALKQVREDMGLTISALAKKTSIQEKYLLAIEAGRYDQTPGPAYVRGFLQSLALALELSPETVLARYAADPTGQIGGAQKAQPGPTARPLAKTYFTHRTIRALAVSAVVVAALVYFGIQVRNVITPPPLEVFYPASDVILFEPQVLLKGSTNPEVTVTVNDKSVQVDRAGAFEEVIDLQPGVNTLVVTASRKRSREAKITRRVIVQLPAVVQ